MKTLILSHRHHLLPLAWRLSREGEQVEAIVVKKRYQKAWEGRLSKALTADRDLYTSDPDVKPWVEAAQLGEIRVVTDLVSSLADLGGSTHLFYTLKTAPPGPEDYSMVLGAWWTGEEWLLHHWYIPEWGLFPGGLGAQVVAGGTVLRGRAYPTESLEQLEGPLREVAFRGLVGVGMRYVQATGKLEPTGYFRAGWEDWLHWGLALCELPSWGSLLEGHPQPTDLPPYTVGVVVSQPPWPAVGHPVPPKVELPITPEVTRSWFFHDIALEDGRVHTAGVDGLVGIARGSGRSLARARQLALLNAGAIAFPERQVRVDVGARVDEVVVSSLEGLGYW